VKKKKEEEDNKNEDKTDEDDKNNSEDSSEEDNKDDDEEDKNKKKNKKFSYDTLEEIPEYVELQSKFSDLQAQIATLNETIESLTNEMTPLKDFKAQAERKEKEDMISKFYMLSDEDKKDVRDNINTYSLEDIEAKLSIICVRNKVSFADDNTDSQGAPTVYNLDDQQAEDSNIPAWVKAALDTAKTLN
jgi:hypothetical protein